MDEQLRSFVHQALLQGISRESIRAELAAAGWQRDEIKEALESYAESDFPVPVPKRRPYVSAREAFLYLKDTTAFS